MAAPTCVLVTGCAGFIGSEFCRSFQREYPKTKIIGIDDLSDGREDAVPDSVVFFKNSILDEKVLAQIFKKYRPEYVFHFAALPRVSFSVEFPVETTETNVIGTLRLLQYSHTYNVRRFIFSSSSSVYGRAQTLPTKESENPANPKSPYALQKYTSEIFCRQWSDLFGLDTVSLRYFNAYGPGQYGNSAYVTVVAAWLESLYFPKNKKGFIEGNGTQSRDFSYIDDIVQANIQAMLCVKSLKGEVFNISSGKAYTLKEVRSLIEETTGRKLDLEKRPERIGDVKHTLSDISKARRVLGFKPKTTFEDGLVATVKWFEDRR